MGKKFMDISRDWWETIDFLGEWIGIYETEYGYDIDNKGLSIVRHMILPHTFGKKVNDIFKSHLWIDIHVTDMELSIYQIKADESPKRIKLDRFNSDKECKEHIINELIYLVDDIQKRRGIFLDEQFMRMKRLKKRKELLKVLKK